MLLSLCAVVCVFCLTDPRAWAQSPVPPAGESGISQKSLEQSRPEFKPPEEPALPEITIEDSRGVEDTGTGPTFFIRKIVVKGNTLLDPAVLAELVDLEEGREMSLGLLTFLAQEITAVFHRNGYINTRAYIPAQEVKDGVVILQVVQGKVARVLVEGNRRIDSGDLVERLQPVAAEPVLRERDLEGALLGLNDIPGIRVRSLLRAGKEAGTSDLVLQVEETRPYRFSFDADNFGSRFTGRNRFGLSAAWSNIMKLGDEISLRAVRSDLGQSFLNPAFAFPITSRGTQAKVSFIYAEYQLGANLAPLNAGGNSNIWTGEVIHPLIRSRSAQVSAGGGLTYRSYENLLQSATSSDDKLFNLFLNIEGFVTDPLRARTYFEGRLRFGFTEGDRTDPLNSRFQGRGNAVVASMNLTRYQSAFFADSYFMMRFTGQVTDRRVLSPDQLAMGGVGSVRGYPLSERAGDEGFFTTLEYVIPLPLELPAANAPKPMLRDLFSLFGFIDHGRVFIKNRQVGERDVDLTGIGGGLRLNVPPGKDGHPAVSFSFTYAIPAFKTPNPSDGSFGTVYLGGLVSF